MPIKPYQESPIPSIIYRRTRENIEAELQRIDNAVPEQLLSEEVVAQARQNISSYNVSHALIASQEMGIEDFNDYIEQACAFFDQSRSL